MESTSQDPQVLSVYPFLWRFPDKTSCNFCFFVPYHQSSYPPYFGKNLFSKEKIIPKCSLGVKGKDATTHYRAYTRHIFNNIPLYRPLSFFAGASIGRAVRVSPSLRCPEFLLGAAVVAEKPKLRAPRSNIGILTFSFWLFVPLYISRTNPTKGQKL